MSASFNLLCEGTTGEAVFALNGVLHLVPTPNQAKYRLLGVIRFARCSFVLQIVCAMTASRSRPHMQTKGSGTRHSELELIQKIIAFRGQCWMN